MIDYHCNHVECACDDPGRLYAYLLEGTEFVGMYCGRHDPRQTRVGSQWQLLDAVVL